MARAVEWAQSAINDLEHVLEYIAEDSPYYAAAFAGEAREAAASLAHFAERGRLVPELRADDIREIFVRSYRLIYQVGPAQVSVLAFIHGARDFDRAWDEDR